MPDWFSDNAPKAAPAASAGGDWFDLYSPSRKPVSAEDFAQPRPSKGWPATIGDFATGLLKGVPAAFEFAKDAAMAGTGDVRALQRTGERLTGAAGAQGEQFRKGREALNATDLPLPVRLQEAGGRFAASALPFVGPGAASAGEAIGRGDTAEGLGEATALLAPLGASTALPYVGRAASAAGRGAQAIAGHPLARLAARKAAEATPYIGPIVRDAQIKGAIADLAAEVRAGRAAPEAPAGGRLVKPAAVVPAEAEMAAMLEDVRAAEPPPPARVTTPPQADLPAGYTPRTTVPKPKPAKAELPAAHPARKAAEAKAAKTGAFTPEEVARAKARLAARDAAAPPARAETQRPYFLRSPEETARFERFATETPEAVAPTDFTDIRNYPASMRGMTDQPIARVTKANAQQMAEAMTAEGVSPQDAMRAVSKDTQLAPNVRLELMTALGKIAKGAKTKPTAVVPAPVETLPGHIEAIKAKHPDLDIFDVGVDKSGDMRLNTMAVSKGGQGVGTRAMEDLVSLADSQGKKITLSLAEKGFSPFKGAKTTSPARLAEFYERFGFVRNKGKYKDFSISDDMYRLPKGSK